MPRAPASFRFTAAAARPPASSLRPTPSSRRRVRWDAKRICRSARRTIAPLPPSSPVGTRRRASRCCARPGSDPHGCTKRSEAARRPRRACPRAIVEQRDHRQQRDRRHHRGAASDRTASVDRRGHSRHRTDARRVRGRSVARYSRTGDRHLHIECDPRARRGHPRGHRLEERHGRAPARLADARVSRCRRPAGTIERAAGV